MATKNTSAYQLINGELVELYYKTTAAQVMMADSTTAEAAITGLKTTLETFLKGDPDGGDIDRLSELLASIKANKDNIDALVADHVKKTEIVNDLTTGGADKVLAAEQGKALKSLLDTANAALDAIKEKTDKITIDEDGGVSVEGMETKAYVKYAATLPDTVPEDLADGGLLIVG